MVCFGGGMEKRARFQRPEMPDEFVDLEYDLHRVEARRGVLELAVRQLRAFARCLTANRTEADDLVEDTLMLFLAEDRILRESEACFAELLVVLRRVQPRAGLIQLSRSAAEPDYAAFLTLPMPEREVAALVISGGMSASHAAELLELPLPEVENLLQSAITRLEGARLPEWPFLPTGGNEYDQEEGHSIL